jgi:HlyD family secretion protein
MPVEKKDFATFENFNELLRVVDTRAWIAFTSVFFLIGCCILWLFFGNIPTKILGTGMLINVSGIERINSNVSGKIATLNVKIGDYIKKDQPVASISQWTLSNEIQNQEQKITDQEIANQQTEQIAVTQEEKYKKERDDLIAKWQTLQKMLQIGSASETEVMDAKQRITETEKKIDELNFERIKKKNDLNQLRRTLESLKKQYARESIILSPNNGVVV